MTSILPRLRELHHILLRQIERHEYQSASKTLLEIDRSSRAANILSDDEIFSVSGDERAGIWLRMVQTLRGNNQPNEAFEVAKLWRQDRGAA